MIYETREITLKNGSKAVFCSPSEADAAELLEYLKITAQETDFLLRYPEECTMTLAQEEAYLRSHLQSPYETMILCRVDGTIAGNCQFARKTKLKNRHRATIGIALLRQYWDLGIGTAMFREMIRLAKEEGIEQLELEVFEGNTRAMALYEKMGFRTVGAIPNAICLKDGTRLHEYYMVKEI